MTDSIPDHVAREVLRHYPAVDSGAVLHGLGNRGGFSGACLWRVEQATAALCLRAWPPQALAMHHLGRACRAAVGTSELDARPGRFSSATDATENRGRLYGPCAFTQCLDGYGAVQRTMPGDPKAAPKRGGMAGSKQARPPA